MIATDSPVAVSSSIVRKSRPLRIDSPSRGNSPNQSRELRADELVGRAGIAWTDRRARLLDRLALRNSPKGIVSDRLAATTSGRARTSDSTRWYTARDRTSLYEARLGSICTRSRGRA